MNIYTALIYAKQGCGIRRTSSSWKKSLFLTKMSDADENNIQCCNDDTGVYWHYLFSFDDVSSDDWGLYTPTHERFQ